MAINSSPYNRAWLIKCEYIRRYNENNRDLTKKEIKEVVSTISNIKTRYLSIIYESYYKLLDLDENKCEQELCELYAYSLNSDNLAFIETCAISLLKFYMELGRIDDFESFVEKYEEVFIPSEDFEYKKAYAYARHFAKFEKLEEIIYNSNKSTQWKILFFNYLCDTNQKDRAKQLLDSSFPNDTEKLIRYYSMSNDDRLIETLEKYWESNPHTLADISMYACTCIKYGQAAKAYKLCKQYYDNPIYFDGVLYVNYFLADQKYNNKDNSTKIRSKILDKKDLFPDIVVAAAYALVNDKNNMYLSLNAAIKDHILYKFDISDWPVFAKYANEERFKKLAEVSELMNFDKKTDII